MLSLVAPRLGSRHVHAALGGRELVPAVPVERRRDGEKRVRLKPRIIVEAGVAHVPETRAEIRAVRVCGLLGEHLGKVFALESDGVFVLERMRGQKPPLHREELAVRVAGARVSAYPAYPPVGKREPLADAPKLLGVVHQLRRNLAPALKAVEVEERDVREALVHVADVHVAVMVQGPVAREVRADEPALMGVRGRG